MRYDELPHAGINELMHWVRKQGKHVVSIQTWAQTGYWTAHITLEEARSLHAQIKREGPRFVITELSDDLACPACAGLLVSSPYLHSRVDHMPESWLSPGGY